MKVWFGTMSWLREAEYATSECTTWNVDYFKMKTIRAQENQKELFHLPLNCREKFLQGAYTRQRTITTGDCLYQKDLSAWHGNHLFIKCFLFSSFCELFSCPLKSQTSTIFPRLRIVYNPQLPTCWGVSYFYRAPVYTEYSFLLLISFMSM